MWRHACTALVCRAFGVSPHTRTTRHEHMPFCSARSSFRASAPSSILGSDHFGATSIDSAPLRSVRPSSSSAVVEAILRPLPPHGDRHACSPQHVVSTVSQYLHCQAWSAICILSWCRSLRFGCKQLLELMNSMMDAISDVTYTCDARDRSNRTDYDLSEVAVATP
jgi:hypothetical protein